MDNRIKAIASLITKKINCVYDVGSDHSFLGILLLKQKKTKHIVNIENKAKPLKNGLANLKKENLLSKSENILNEGLSNITKKVDVLPDCITISGMGGLNIIDILKKTDKKIEPKYFLLQANNNIVSLRKWLIENNFKISKELVTKDSKFYYTILKAVHSIKLINNYDENEFCFGKFSNQLDKNTWYNFLKYKLKYIKNNRLDEKSKSQKKLKQLILEGIIKYENWKNSK